MTCPRWNGLGGCQRVIVAGRLRRTCRLRATVKVGRTALVCAMAIAAGFSCSSFSQRRQVAVQDQISWSSARSGRLSSAHVVKLKRDVPDVSGLAKTVN